MKKHIITPIIAFLFATVCANAQSHLTLSFTPSIKDYIDSLSDIKVEVFYASASSTQSGENIEKSFDGDMSTYYHSLWDNSANDYFPITLQYNFWGDNEINSIIYRPRMDGSDGNFKEITVYYKLRGGDEVKYKDYDFEGSSSISTVSFDTPLVNVDYIKIVVKSGVGDGKGFASCAEMEFYDRKDLNFDLNAYFVDDICSALQPGVTRESLMASNIPGFLKQVGLALLEEDYAECRVQEYQPYRPINDLASELKLHTYNPYENPTGVYIVSGEPIVVFVPKDTKGQTVSLLSREWRNDVGHSYALKPGELHCSNDKWKYLYQLLYGLLRNHRTSQNPHLWRKSRRCILS